MELGPQERAAFLAEVNEQSRSLEWQRSAVPPLTGDLANDLYAADQAVTRVEEAWNDAQADYEQLRSAGGPFPGTEAYRKITAAKRRADELWRLRTTACRNRDQLEARAGQADEPLPWFSEQD